MNRRLPSPVRSRPSAPRSRWKGTASSCRWQMGIPFVAIRDALVTTGVGLRSLGVRSTSLEDIFLEEGQNDQ